MKKQIIRILSVIIAVMVISASLPLATFAASVPSLTGYLSLDESISISNPGKATYYGFYSQTAGSYQIKSSGISDTFVTAYDSDMSSIGFDDDGGEDGNFSLSLDLEAEKYYYFKIGAYDSEQFYINISLVPSAEDIILFNDNGEEISAIYGHVGESIGYMAELFPSGATGEEIEWTSHDSDIVSVDETGEVTFLSAGDTFITLSSGSLVKTVAVTSVNMTELILDEESSLNLGSSKDHLCLTFTAERAGDYRFLHTDTGEMYITLWSSTGRQLNTSYSAFGEFHITLQEAEQIIIKIEYLGSEEITFNITPSELISATDIEIIANSNGSVFNQSYYNVYVGDYINLSYNFLPLGAFSNETITFESSDPEIVSVTVDGYAEALGEGSAMITAYSDSFYKYIYIHASNKEQIVFGDSYNVYLDANNLGTYEAHFTADDSRSNHKLILSASKNINIDIFSENGEYILYNYIDKATLRFNANPSENYRIRFYSSDTSEPIYIDFALSSYIPAEELSITDEEYNDISYLNCNVGDSFQLNYLISPEGADDSEIVWSSDNEAVASVTADGWVTIYSAGSANITLSQGYLSDTVSILAEKIIDTDVGYSHNITIENYTARLRFTPKASGYYYFDVSGDGYQGVNVQKLGADESVECDAFTYISENEARQIYYLTANTEYRIFPLGNFGSTVLVNLGQYAIPENFYITDSNGNIKTEVGAYLGETFAFYTKYDKTDCYLEPVNWTSSDNTIASVNSFGEITPHKEGSVTITAETKTNFKATVKLTVKKGELITENTNLNHQFTKYDERIRLVFTPSVTGNYEFSAQNTQSGEQPYFEFTLLDSEYNELYSSWGSYISALLQGGKTYIIKIAEKGMGGNYTFSVCNKTLSLGEPYSIAMDNNGSDSANYYFIPSQSGYYRFYASEFSNNQVSANISIFNSENENIAESRSGTDYFESFATLNANEVYRISVSRFFTEPFSFSLLITKQIGIQSMEIITNPHQTTITLESHDVNLTGLSLNVTLTNGENSVWTYNNMSSDICGFAYSYTISTEVDGVRYVYLKAGGAVCIIPLTVIETPSITVDSPVSITFKENYDNIQYRFTPEKSGYYLIKSYNHSPDLLDRNMDIRQGDQYITTAINVGNETLAYVYLEANTSYTINMYKYFSSSDTFTLYVTESVTISSISIKKQPLKTTYLKDSSGVDLSGLELFVTTSDGKTSVWKYAKGSNKILDYPFHASYRYDIDSVLSYTIRAGAAECTLNFTPITIEKIEAITGGGIKLVENTNGYTSGEAFIYFTPTSQVKIKITYSDSTYVFASPHENVDGFPITVMDTQYEKPWTLGDNNSFTINYMDKSLSVPVSIIKNTVKSMTLIDDGDVTITEGMADFYLYEGWVYNPDMSRVKIKLEFENGQSIIATPEDSVNGIWFDYHESMMSNPILPGKDNYITITYADKSVDIPVTLIENNIKNVTLTKSVPDVDYIFGDENIGYGDGDEFYIFPSFSDGYEFTIEYNDGSFVKVTPEDTFGDRYNGGSINIGTYNDFVTLGSNEAYLAWGGFVVDFNINVIASDVSSIEVIQLPTVYENIDYYSDMAGLTVKINYSNNTSETVTLEADDIIYNTNYYSAKINNSTMMISQMGAGEYYVSYKACSTTFSLGTGNEFEITNLEIIKFDESSQKLTVKFDYSKHGTTRNETIVLNLKDGDLRIGEYDISCTGVYKSDSGVAPYYFSYNSNLENKTRNLYLYIFNYNYNITQNLSGDINNDGAFDVRDLVRLKKLLANQSESADTLADFSGDGDANATDLIYLKNAILGTCALSLIDGDVNGDCIFDNADKLALNLYIEGANQMLSSRADINLDGIIDKKDFDLIILK